MTELSGLGRRKYWMNPEQQAPHSKAGRTQIGAFLGMCEVDVGADLRVCPDLGYNG